MDFIIARLRLDPGLLFPLVPSADFNPATLAQQLGKPRVTTLATQSVSPGCPPKVLYSRPPWWLWWAVGCARTLPPQY